MTMKTIKVAEATNTQLDWLVARCEGAESIAFNGEYWIVTDVINGWEYLGNLNYTTSPDLMWPIIEREEIGTRRNVPCSKGREWEASPSPTAKGAGGAWGYGSTSLVAAARCYVASKLGETVEVPEELV